MLAQLAQDAQPSTMVALARRAGSYAISFMLNTGAHGTP
jgi:hypothetical protein